MVMDNIFVKTAMVSTIIFVIGVWLGLWLGQEKISTLETTIQDIQQSIDNAELQFLMMDIIGGRASCEYMIKTADALGEESEKMAKEVGRYENTQKIDDVSFYALKEKYTNTLVRNWLITEKIKKTCNGTYSTVLYFYSNKVCDKCEEQGIVLSYFKEKLGQNIMTFSLDTDLGVTAVDVLRSAYNITEYPATVINNDVYKGFNSKEEIMNILCNYNADLSLC